MYDPAPTRPRKTDNTRTRQGCMQCRRKRRKCDQEKPACRRCVKSMAACEYATTVEFRDATAWAAERVRESKQARPTAAARAAKSRARRAAVSSPLSPCTEDSADSSALSSPEDLRRGLLSAFQTHSPDGLGLVAEEIALTADHDANQSLWRMRLAVEAATTTVTPTPTPPRWDHMVVTLPSPRMHSVEVWASATCMDTPPILDWSTQPLDDFSLLYTLEPRASRSSTSSSSPPSSEARPLHDPLPVEDYRFDTPDFGVNPMLLSQDPQLLQSPHITVPTPLATDSFNPVSSPTLHRDSFPQAHDQDDPCNHSSDYEQTWTQNWALATANAYESAPRGTWPSAHPLVRRTPSPAAPALPRVLSTACEIAVGDRIYLAHFTLHMIGVLPPQLRSLQQVATNAEPMLLAVLGLAAANMANLQGTQEHDRQGKSRWAPKDSHQKQATKLISRALHLISSDPHLSRPMRLGVAVLLAYSHLEFGTFVELFRATRRLEAMILENIGDGSLLLKDERGILQGWSYLRAFCKRIHPIHRPYGVESRTEHLLDTLEERVASPSHLVDLIRVDALHLTYRVFLYRCMRGHGSSPKETLRNISTWWDIVKGTTGRPPNQFHEDDFDTIIHEEDAHSALLELAAKLDCCETPREFPVDVDSYPDQHALYVSSLEDAPALPPLRFSNHERAMECIDYAFAHIVCDWNLLERAASSRPASWAHGGEVPSTLPNCWLALILRIAEGLDPAECARRNTYRTGVVGQVMRASLICGERAGLEFLDGFLQRMMSSCACYEDILTPVHLSYLANKALLKEYSLGRHVFFGGVTYSHWTDKDIVFSKGEGQYFIICGREKDGRFFNDCVPLLDES
ncbi:hypothetical protein GQ53DRAFT_818714 [Thozetella sp. PMI_491]|nr:hypothetical protein GQ53DRAFT_818714 [Thozetella sp. PMI_491]